MKTKHDIKTLLLGAILGGVILFSIGAATNQGTTKAWEYKTITGTVGTRDKPNARLDYLINTTISEGWDFVSASGTSDFYGFAVMRREKK